MAQFYKKSHSQERNAFDSSQMFLGESEVSKLSGTTYLEVLNVFKRVFKGLNINELTV